jgi:hypothetical protein
MKGRYILKKLFLVVPIMILVAILAMWMLGKEYTEIGQLTRMMISAGAAVLSGIISFFLFAADKDR